MSRRKISFEGQMRLPFEEVENEEPKPAVPIRRNVYAAAEIAQPKKRPRSRPTGCSIICRLAPAQAATVAIWAPKKGGVLIDAGVKTDIVEAALRPTELI